MVVATNVAETSLTIDGVRLVIDSGLARIPRYDPYRGINTLLIEKISRAAADQRAGRAGPHRAGRLPAAVVANASTRTRRPQELPEIKRLDLAEVVLTLKAAGVEDLRKFRWLEPPEEQALAHAEELLVGPGRAEAPAAGRHVAARGRRMPALLPSVGGYASPPIGRQMLAFPAAPALRADAARGAGLRLRLSGLPRRRAHAGTRPAAAQRGQAMTARRRRICWARRRRRTFSGS